MWWKEKDVDGVAPPSIVWRVKQNSRYIGH
jgi:hypothetical protein